MTADDVLFTVAALSDPSYAGPGAASWREVTASSTDPLTVTLKLATPLGGFLQAATQGIAPAHLLAGIAPADLPADGFGRRPIGSGRSGWLPSTRLTPCCCRTWPTRHRPPTRSPTTAAGRPIRSTTAPTAPSGTPLPYLDGIDFRFYADVDALTSAWALGQIDAAVGLPADVAIRLAGSGGAPAAPISIHDPLRGDVEPPADASRVPRRQGPQGPAGGHRPRCDHADVLGGLATQADSLIPPSSWAFDPTVSAAVPHDVAQSRPACWRRAGSRRRPGAGSPRVAPSH